MTVKSHNDAFHTTTIFGIGTLGENVMNLLLRSVETEIANLEDGKKRI